MRRHKLRNLLVSVMRPHVWLAQCDPKTCESLRTGLRFREVGDMRA